MKNKLGLIGDNKKDKILILDLLTWMHQKKVDFTNTFCHLMNEKIEEDHDYKDENFKNWKIRWNKRLKENNSNLEKSLKIMKSFNPLVIPRNHKVEEALKEAEKDNLKPIHQLIKTMRKPYTKQADMVDYQTRSSLDKKYQTFCGT